MEAVLNPFRANLLAMGDRMLQSHRTVTDWQINQMKVAEKQMADWMSFSRAAVDASTQASHGMARTMLDVLAPAEKSA
jgi:hypothetical protein